MRHPSPVLVRAAGEGAGRAAAVRVAGAGIPGEAHGARPETAAEIPVAEPEAIPGPDRDSWESAEPADSLGVPVRFCLWTQKDWVRVWSVFSFPPSNICVLLPDTTLADGAANGVHSITYHGARGPANWRLRPFRAEKTALRTICGDLVLIDRSVSIMGLVELPIRPS